MSWRFKTALEFKETLGEKWHGIAQELLVHWSEYLSEEPVENAGSIWAVDINDLLGTTPEPEIQFWIERRLDTDGQTTYTLKNGGEEQDVPYNSLFTDSPPLGT